MLSSQTESQPDRRGHKIVFCAGLNRSGSTLQFNIVRKILENCYGTDQVYCCWVANYIKDDTRDIHVIKIHDPDDARGIKPDVVISSYRDLRAVMGSLVRMRWGTTEPESIITYLDRYIASANTWENIANVFMPYSKLIRQTHDSVKEIALALEIQLDDRSTSAIISAVSALRMPGAEPSGSLESADPETQLHAGHIGDVSDELARQRLPPDAAALIEIRYQDWMSAHGFNDLSPRFAAQAAANYARLDQFETCGCLPPKLRLNEPFVCKIGLIPAGLVLYGFDVEDWGAWSVGRLSAIQFQHDDFGVDLDLVVVAGALTIPGSPPVITTAYANGREIDSWYWRDKMDAQNLRIPLQSGCGRQVISFLTTGPRSPQSLGMGEDCRMLGIAMFSLRLEASNADTQIR
jgi:hypothetical protein